MKWRKVNNLIHRDLGYLFFGVTIVYCLSGIALNHLKDWNPSYIIEANKISVNPNENLQSSDKNLILDLFSEYFDENEYKNHYYPEPGILKIFIKNGTLTLNTSTGEGVLEKVTKRPLFYEVNILHYNPNVWWTYFSDGYSVALILIAVTGLLVIKGKKGIKGRGAWLTIIGVLIPVLFLILL